MELLTSRESVLLTNVWLINAAVPKIYTESITKAVSWKSKATINVEVATLGMVSSSTSSCKS